MIGLGIDAGGSSTRWLLRDEAGVEIGRGTAGPITGHVFTPADLEATRERLLALIAEVLTVARPDAVVAGITGYHPRSEASEALARAICDRLGIGHSRASLVDDMLIAYASVFEPGQGVLLYAGTGSVGYHVGVDGTPLRVGGYGYLIDDAGAGYWIGHQGIRQTMRWTDEAQGARQHPLARTIHGALGCHDWDDIAIEVYRGGRQRVAALAPAVAEAAEAGDEAAVAILRTAGTELARLANLLSARIGRPLPVAFTGGIARLSPLLNDSLRAELGPGTSFEVVNVEPITAAARMAIELAGGAQVTTG
ncbi:MAG: BadF/BadG/BcrA/BcrD ATPase family protein [Trueperaceae bacterium]